MSSPALSSPPPSAPGWLARFSILLIRGYQRWISPFLRPSCRFVPSCSSYAVGAFEKYGVFRGGAKTCLRILRCNPLFPGGFDPP